MQPPLTPAAIEEATASLPAEIQPLSGQDINRKLKARVQALPRAIDRYHALLAQRVDVVGSNEKEVFKVERLAGGRVRVQEFARRGNSPEPNGPVLFERTQRNLSLRARWAGYFSGNRAGRRARSIVVRVLGGAGKDKIADDSRASGLRGLTKIYDMPSTDLAAGSETADRRSASRTVNLYGREAFEFSSAAPGLVLQPQRRRGTVARVGLRAAGFP